MKHCPNCEIDADWNTADCPVCLDALIEDHEKAAHDAAWEKNFVKPIGREMKKRGIAYMVMILREDGKLIYVLDKEIPENTESQATAKPLPALDGSPIAE